MVIDITPAQLAECFELAEGKYPKVRDSVLLILGTFADADVPTAVDDLTGGLYMDENASGTGDALKVIGKASADTFGAQTVLDTNGGSRRNVVLGSVTVALTEAMSGSFVDVDSASLAFTLPAITANNIGMYFDFHFSVVATTVTITAGAADLLNGAVGIVDFDTANTVSYFKADGVDDLIMTLNGTTKGGKIGTSFRLTAATAARWDISLASVFGDGTLVTPFS